MNLVYCLALVLLLPLVSAETTFFEGGEMDYIILNESHDAEIFCGNGVCDGYETCGSCSVDCGECERESEASAGESVEVVSIEEEAEFRRELEEKGKRTIQEKGIIIKNSNLVFGTIGILVVMGIIAYILGKRKLRGRR